jgi:ankyrin repeat protein
MSALMKAVKEGDLEKLKRLVADGADVAEVDASGYTALLEAAYYGRIPIMHWLLNEGGSSLAETNIEGMSALLLTALTGRFPAMKYLLVEQGASMSESNNDGDTVWYIIILRTNLDESAELFSLLKVMVMLEDAPADFIANPKLSPQHLDICTRGRQLRAQLPSYLKQQRAALVAQCPLPAVLRCLVTAYAVTTPEDMWADGLRM